MRPIRCIRFGEDRGRDQCGRDETGRGRPAILGFYGTAKLDLLDMTEAAVAVGWSSLYPRSKAGSRSFFPVPIISLPSAVFLPFRLLRRTGYGGGGVAARQGCFEDYTVWRYHQQGDEWQPDWTSAGAARDVAVLYALGRVLTDEARHWPNWAEDSEFRALRDASAAARE